MIKLRSISLVLLFVIIVVTGCETKSNNGLSMPTEKDLQSCDRGWSKEFLRKNLSDCIARTGNKLSASEAYKYCECMMDKVQEKYPEESDAVNKATKEELADIETSCLTDQDNLTSQEWTSTDKDEFINECSSKMNGSLGGAKAKNYCECMLGKIMSESPDVNKADNISRSVMNRCSSDCLK